ncbi:uncharacterized protein CLAFUR5_09113 [Fulvia fulva]|uniref:FAD-binding PCMH-type domain-containing protein n=1 Tax=Passalora fulva TaxID=5499 RepID=A0A9Q8UTB9_PASFU|nr:uncharacterized protein CLAFUR5_09113 [Fulvia fulva]UJO21642.1 hypothetical protein CLAFUR5_09113 [Fulvia fulva]
MASTFAPEKPMDDRIAIVAKALGKDPDFCKHDVPGLAELLNDYLNPAVEVDRFAFMRRLLRMFRESGSDDTYQKLRDEHTDDEKSRLEKFVDGSLAEDLCEGFCKGHSLSFRHHAKHFLEGAKEVVEQILDIDDEEAVMDIRKDLEFQNWGRTLQGNVPKLTCVPRTVVQIQKIVQFAKQSNMSVRCSGYRHSWSPIFGRSGEILISTLQLKTASELPNFAAQTFLSEEDPGELETIELLDEPPLSGGKRLVRIGCAATNERLRRWCVKHNQVTLPFNIIMVEITAGGSNAPICHGAGITSRTLSDLVHRIEYIDANGILRMITENDTEFLTAASGCFGLLGVVTHLTLVLDPMTYAELRPAKVPVVLAIPPPDDMWDKVPPSLLPKQPLTIEQKRKAKEDFEHKANNDYYSEWFWFPYADECWINCWNNTTDSSHVKDWPDSLAIFVSFLQEFTLNVLQYNKVLTKLVDKTNVAEAAVSILSRFAMMNLPEVKEDEPPIKTYLCDALHFQRAIQNVRVRDLEVEMPLVPLPDNPTKPDYSYVQRAWWDAILKAYEHSDTCPQRFPLEMRIMGGSNVLLAPQHGNTLGTCSIEILTLQNAVDIWQPYAQEVLNKWMSYNDHQGHAIKTRPHWAKEWSEGYTVASNPMLTHLKTSAYASEIPKFRHILAAIGKTQGWTLQDIQKRFSNDLFDDLIFDNVRPPAAVGNHDQDHRKPVPAPTTNDHTNGTNTSSGLNLMRNGEALDASNKSSKLRDKSCCSTM